MYQYIFPHPSFVPSSEIHRAIRKAPYDIKFTTVGDTPYEGNTPLALTKSQYIDGASESDTLNVFLIFQTEKTTDELAAIKTLIDTARSNFNPSDAKYAGAYKHLES